MCPGPVALKLQKSHKISILGFCWTVPLKSRPALANLDLALLKVDPSLAQIRFQCYNSCL
jgi:hypothetical protein